MFSIKRMLADLKVYSKGFLRSKIGLFFSLIFPVILILLFGAIFAGNGGGPATVYVQNQDGLPASNLFIAALNGSNGPTQSATWPITLVLVGQGENMSSFLQSHSSSDGLIVPPGFTMALQSGTEVNLTLYGNPASTTSEIVREVVSSVVNEFNLKGAQPTIGVKTLTATTQSTKYIDFLIPGLIGFAVLTSPMFALVNISSQYKRDKVFKLLSLTPLTKTEWLLAKIVWYVVLTAISFLLMCATGIYGFGAHVTFSWGILPFLILGPFLFVSLGMLVGTVSNSPESAAVVGNLITFPMMFLSGTFFPVSGMPMYLQTIAHFLPLFYVIDGLNNVMIYQNIAPAYLDLGVLLVTAAIIFALAVKFFRWRED